LRTGTDEIIENKKRLPVSANDRPSFLSRSRSPRIAEIVPFAQINRAHMQKPARNLVSRVSIISRKIHFSSKSCAHASEVNGARRMVRCIQTPPAVNLLRTRREKKRRSAQTPTQSCGSRGVSPAHTRERNHNHYKQ
jgi:hypothetical protein